MPFPTPGDLSDPGIKFASLVSPALGGGYFTTAPPEKSIKSSKRLQKIMQGHPLRHIFKE